MFSTGNCITIRYINGSIGFKTFRKITTSSFKKFPGINNLNISGIPIFQDHFIPDTNFFAVNCKYTSMYISEDAAMDFSGFYSLVPLNQIGQQGVMVLGYNLISSKSSSGAWVYGFGGSIW